MSYGSSAPEVIDRLFTVLDARSGLDHVEVLSHYPEDPSKIKGDTGVSDAVFLGRVGSSAITGSAVWPVLGHTFVDEVYTVWLTCQSLKDSSSGTEVLARKRAYELMAEVVGAVLSDPTLGITETAAMNTFEIGGRLSDGPYEIEDGGGWLTPGYGWRVSIGLHCTARITLT